MENPFLNIQNDLTLIKNVLHTLCQQVETIKAIDTSAPEQHFDLPALCQYLPDKPKIETAREWARVGQIPCHKKGKKYYFLKSEIDEFLRTGRKKTKAEKMDELRIEAEKQLEVMRNKTK